MRPRQDANLVPYEKFRSIVRDGDLLLWRPTSLLGRCIALGTKSSYSHASMAAFTVHGRLYGLEMMQWIGGQHIPLSVACARWPQSCELWRPISPAYQGRAAVKQMLWLMGQHYGWRGFFRQAVKAIWPKAWLLPCENDDDPNQPLVCSAAFHWAARTGGRVTFCHNQCDMDVSPADLANSGLAEYLCTPVL